MKVISGAMEFYKITENEMTEKEQASLVREGLKVLGISNKYREEEKFIMTDPHGKYNTKEYGHDLDSNHVYIWVVINEN